VNIADHNFYVAVVGQGDEFVLLPLPINQDSASLKIARLRGYPFVGMFGLENGEPHVRVEPDTDAIITMCYAAPVFARHVRDLIRSQCRFSAKSFA
jgi:hypothetical protein